MDVVFDFVGVGGLGIDFIRIGGETYRRGGGAAANTIAALQALGLRTGFISAVGCDPEGDELVNELAGIGVDITCIDRDQNFQTGIAEINVKDGDREIKNVRIFSRTYTITDERKRYLKNARGVLIGPRLSAHQPNIFEKYASLARKNNIRLYVTLHKTSEISKKTLKAIADAQPRAIFGSEDEMKALDCKDILSFLPSCEVVVTRAQRGVVIYTENETYTYPAFSVPCVDPTGAGDAFAAGYIYGDFKQWGIKKKATFAQALAALTIQQIGARSKLYSKQNVENFIIIDNCKT